MTYTYIQTTDKNGKARFYKVDENGKRKVISRKEYEANTTEQISMEAVEVEVPAAEVETTETVFTAEPIEAPAEPETCTALVVPFNLGAAIAELHERKALENIDMTVPSIEETALDTVKAIIAGMDGKHSSKVRLQATKKGVQVRYRNCAVCALVSWVWARFCSRSACSMSLRDHSGLNEILIFGTSSTSPVRTPAWNTTESR